MNYRDFFKKEAVTAQLKDAPKQDVNDEELKMGIKVEMEHTTDESTARTIAMHHLAEDPKYYTHMKSAGLKEDHIDSNGGLPKRDGALNIPHLGQPIHMAKIINVGSFGAGSATGELSGMTPLGSESSAVSQGVSAPGDKEPITAGGKEADKAMASKSVGGPEAPGAGQKQGGPNTKGCIADTPANPKIEGGEAKGGKPGRSPNSAGTIGGTAALGGGCPGAPEAEDVVVDLMEAKEAHGIIQELIGEVLEEIDFDEKSGKWLNESNVCQKCKGTGHYWTKLKDLSGKNPSGVDDTHIVACDAPGCHGGKVDRDEYYRGWGLNEGKHKAGCQCGFCKNKGNFGKKAKKGEKDDKKEKKNPFADKGKKKDDKKAKGNPFAKKKEDKEEVDECFEAGPQYKVAGRQYRVAKDDIARSRQQTPEMTESEKEMNKKKDKWAGWVGPKSARDLRDPKRTDFSRDYEKGPLSKMGRFITSKIGDLEEAAPPGFEPGEKHGHVLLKLKKQYGKDSPKTYATAWAIYNKMKEGAIVQTESGWKRRNPDQQGNSDDKIKEGRCEDYPCCGHESGDCPDRDAEGNETWRCARCRAKLPKGASSSLCNRCRSRMQKSMDDDPTGQDLDNFQEASYKVASPTQARGSKYDHARTVQTDPEVTEADNADNVDVELPASVDEPGEKIDTHLYGHKGQKGYVLWVCERCGHELVRNRTSHNRPKPVTWRDGHTCRFVPSPDQPTKVTSPTAGAGMAEQSFKKGARTYRTFLDSPQFPDAVRDPEVAETMSPDDADKAREFAGEHIHEMARIAVDNAIRGAKSSDTVGDIAESAELEVQDQHGDNGPSWDVYFDMVCERLGLDTSVDPEAPVGSALRKAQQTLKEESTLKEVIRSIVKEIAKK
jgi:hypothetical protein